MSMDFLSVEADTVIDSKDLHNNIANKVVSIQNGSKKFVPFRNKNKKINHKIVDPLEQAIAATKLSKQMPKSSLAQIEKKIRQKGK